MLLKYLVQITIFPSDLHSCIGLRNKNMQVCNFHSFPLLPCWIPMAKSCHLMCMRFTYMTPCGSAVNDPHYIVLSPGYSLQLSLWTRKGHVPVSLQGFVVCPDGALPQTISERTHIYICNPKHTETWVLIGHKAALGMLSSVWTSCTDCLEPSPDPIPRP